MTSQSNDSVSSTLRSSMIWNTLELGASQVLTIVVYMLLTYRLTPEVFGIFAIGAFFIDFLYLQAQTAAVDVMLIEDKVEPSRIDRLFGNMLPIYIAGFALALVISILVSQSFDEEKYKLVLPVMCLCLLPIPFQIPALYKLNKIRDFKGTAMRNVLASSFGASVALVLAFSPYPEWALVGQRLGQTLSSAIFVCLRAGFWPSFSGMADFDKSFLILWGKAFSSQAMIVGQSRGLDLVIATGLGTAALGILRIGMRLVDAIYGALAAPIGKLWVILVPENTSARDVMGKIFVDFTKMTALLLLPTFTGLLLVSDELVTLLLDDAYFAVADILKVVCVAGLFSPFIYFRNAAFTAIKRLNLLIFLSGLDIIIVTAAGALLVRYGLTAATCSLIASAMVGLFTTVPVLLREFDTRLSDMIWAVVPVYTAAALMSLCVLGLGTVLPDWPVAVILGAKVGVGAVSFIGYLFVFQNRWLRSTIGVIVPKFAPE